ncbi:MAG: ArnT family glycosyltransferase [Desulfococcaceae bacterium]
MFSFFSFKNRDTVLPYCLVLTLLLLIILSVILLSLVPPVSRDAMVHHLAIPKLYLRHGGMYEIPHMSFSYYPMNIDLLYMIPLYFGNDTAPKFIHFSFALFTAWLIFHYVKEKTDTVWALAGAAFFLSIPAVVKLSITAYVDLGLVFFSTASFFLLFEWMKNEYRIKFLIFSGISCGLAMGVKYSGLIICFLLTMLVLYVFSLYHPNNMKNLLKGIGYGLIFLLVSLLVFSPWMIRNWKLKKNPVYPLYDSVFQGQNIESDDMIIGDPTSQYGIFTYRSVIYDEEWWEMAMLPIRIFFQGEDGSGKYFDGKLNPFLLLFPLTAFFCRKKGEQNLRKEKNAMFMFSVLFFAFCFFSRVLRIRYLAPIFPFLAILSVFGAKYLWDMFSASSQTVFQKAGKLCVCTAFAVSVGINANYISAQFRHVEPFPYLAGTVNRDEYIAKYLPEYPAMQFINTKVPDTARILFVFIGGRGYYCDRNYLHDEDKGISILEKLLKMSESPEQILLGLKNLKITHLLIRYSIFSEWIAEHFPPEKQSLTKSFFNKYVSQMFVKNGYGVLFVADCSNSDN